MTWQEAKEQSGPLECAYALTKDGELLRRFSNVYGCVRLKNSTYRMTTKEEMEAVTDWFSDIPVKACK